MATTNFLAFGNDAGNVENDAQYLADAARSGGVGLNTTFSSALANKAFYQWSTFIAAFAQMLVNKGFSPSDVSFSALVGLLANVRTTADQRTPMIGLVFSPTANFDVGSYDNFAMQLTGNLTGMTVSGMTPGRIFSFSWQQDATGGRTVTYPSTFQPMRELGLVGGGPAQPDPTPNAVSTQAFLVLTDGIARPYTPMVVSSD